MAMPRPMALLLWLLLREALGLEPMKNLGSITSGDIEHRQAERHASPPSKPVSAPAAATTFARAEPRGKERAERAAEGRVQAVVQAKGVELTALAETQAKRSMNDCEENCTSSHDPDSDALKTCKQECTEKAVTTPGTSEYREQEKRSAASAQVKCMACLNNEAKDEGAGCDQQTMDQCKKFMDEGAILGAEFDIKKLKDIEAAAEKDMSDGSGAYGVCAGIVVAWALTL